MAKAFHQLLGNSLQRAKKVAIHHIIKSNQLSPTDQSRLIKAGCLQKVIRGWYLLCPPHTDPGESTPWYASFWDFITCYLTDRFADNYCLSPESSLDLYLGKNYLPPQIVVMATTGGSVSLQLPHNTSLLIYQENKRFPQDRVKYNGLNVVPFEYALAKMPPGFYTQQPQEAEIALRMLTSADKILFFLLRDGMVQAAERIVAALRHLGSNVLADTILRAMQAAGFTIIETNPFLKKPLLSTTILKSPYSARIEALWQKMRGDIIHIFPPPVSTNAEKQLLVAAIDSIYVQDAYHSLSIEGYQVSEQLIEKISQGNWQPDYDADDQNQRNAMAAKGYYEAFKLVKKTIVSMLNTEQPIEVLHLQFPNWYLALFSPAVTAGIIKKEYLAGFRNQAVYIRNSMHVPPPYHAVTDCMETLFTCLTAETNAAVRAVLAHWLIGFIHPYNDGNGRMARLFMNSILVSHGYPWLVVRVEQRKAYLEALEKASIHSDIKEFAIFIKEIIQA